MWSALGSTFGLAMGLALSPLAITTALILLLGDRGKLRAVFFAVGCQRRVKSDPLSTSET